MSLKKYLKYKEKYLQLKKELSFFQTGGAKIGDTIINLKDNKILGQIISIEPSENEVLYQKGDTFNIVSLDQEGKEWKVLEPGQVLSPRMGFANPVSGSAASPRAPLGPPPGLVQPPPGLVQPPPGLVQPPPGLVQPPPGLVQPPPGLVQPPSGLVQPPPGLVQPPSGLVQPPPGLVQPPSGLVQPPPGLVQPPSGLVQPAPGLAYHQPIPPPRPLSFLPVYNSTMIGRRLHNFKFPFYSGEIIGDYHDYYEIKFYNNGREEKTKIKKADQGRHWAFD